MRLNPGLRPSARRSLGFRALAVGEPRNDSRCVMEKRAIFRSRLLPYALLAPQLAITLVFFFWPASQAVWQSFLLQDAFGLSTEFVWLENYRDLFAEPDYYRTIADTRSCSRPPSRCCRCRSALLLAAHGRQAARAARGVYTTLLIWPYAVAPAVAGVLWLFMFQPVARHRGARPAQRSASTGTRCSTATTR